MNPARRNKALVFTGNNARVVTFDSIEDLSKIRNCILNYDDSLCGGVPPHYWKMLDGYIMPMNQAERENRDRDIKNRGIDNDIQGANIAEYQKKLAEEAAMQLEEHEMASKKEQEILDGIYAKIDDVKNYTEGCNATVVKSLDRLSNYGYQTKHQHKMLLRFLFLWTLALTAVVYYRLLR